MFDPFLIENKNTEAYSLSLYPARLILYEKTFIPQKYFSRFSYFYISEPTDRQIEKGTGSWQR